MLRKEDFFFFFWALSVIAAGNMPAGWTCAGCLFQRPPRAWQSSGCEPPRTHLSTTFLCLGPSPGLSSYTSFKLMSEDRDRSRTTEMRKLQATKRKKNNKMQTTADF